jgi:hypothetical protein
MDEVDFWVSEGVQRVNVLDLEKFFNS